MAKNDLLRLAVLQCMGFYRVGFIELPRAPKEVNDQLPPFTTALHSVDGGFLGRFLPNTGETPEEAIDNLKTALREEIDRLQTLLDATDSAPRINYPCPTF